MVNRMIINEETVALKLDKELVASGGGMYFVVWLRI